MSFPLDHEGVWCEVLRRPANGAPALFLDRDGVVVEEVEYLCRAEDVFLIPAAETTIAMANAMDVAVIIVTNQSGIGRARYEWTHFAEVQREILAKLSVSGAFVDAVYAAPHHPDGRGKWRHADHPARKPNPGMLTRAASELGIDLARSWLIGDKCIDIVAARRAGLAGALHVLTGHGKRERASIPKQQPAAFELRLGASIADATYLLQRISTNRQVGADGR